jgi:hypothetical protein
MASSAAEVRSGVCKATPARRRAAASTSAAVGKETGLPWRDGSAAIARQASPRRFRPCRRVTIARPRRCRRAAAASHAANALTGRTVRRRAPAWCRPCRCPRSGNCAPRRAAIAARDVVEQPLELVDVLFDGLPEFRIGAIFAADFVERLLALGRVEAPGEQAAFAALIALPQGRRPRRGRSCARRRPQAFRASRRVALRAARTAAPAGGAIGGLSSREARVRRSLSQPPLRPLPPPFGNRAAREERRGGAPVMSPRARGWRRRR